MSTRRNRRRPMACGKHRGFGKFCHRCKQAKQLRAHVARTALAPEAQDKFIHEAERLEASA